MYATELNGNLVVDSLPRDKAISETISFIEDVAFERGYEDGEEISFDVILFEQDDEVSRETIEYTFHKEPSDYDQHHTKWGL